jgi:hypothetical protein
MVSLIKIKLILDISIYMTVVTWIALLYDIGLVVQYFLSAKELT